MLVIGFTGTRKGMTDSQLAEVEKVLSAYKGNHRLPQFHHGDCIGSDAQAHSIAKDLGYWVVVHPPINPEYRAYCEGDQILKPLPYIVRNHAIVDACEILIATPAEVHEVLRSGTWATIRYARTMNRRTRKCSP